jgi:hypothetical protein
MTGPTRSATGNGLVKVAYANDEAEAELLQGLLRTADGALVALVVCLATDVLI